LRGSVAAPRIGGVGEPIDHLVCMRRLPAGALLCEQLAQGTLSPASVDGVARCIADFHRRANVARRSIAFGWPEQVLQAALDVVKQLDASDRRVADVRVWIEEQAWWLWDLWLERRRGGFVKECHGDLHLANVACVGTQVIPFDCLEFSGALRWTDVMGDAAFLAMDLDARGRRDLAFRFLDAYLESTGDFAGVRVLRFQLVYRALVRAMAGVADPYPATGAYLDAALRWSRPAPARLLITHGLSGSGKSSAALALLQRAGAIRIRSDVERARLFASVPGHGAAAHARQFHTPDVDRRVMERLIAGAQAVLAAGFPVIVDATFLRAADREAFRCLAQAEGVPFNILDCQADVATLRRRIESRLEQGADASDATLSVLAQQQSAREPLSEREQACAFRVDAEVPLDVEALAARWLAQATATALA
jgi:hypothetical protein